MIEPECTYGYTASQVKALTGDREEEFWHWMRGQTMTICSAESCGVAHGMPIVYRWDLERFLAGLSVID